MTRTIFFNHRRGIVLSVLLALLSLAGLWNWMKLMELDIFEIFFQLFFKYAANTFFILSNTRFLS